MESAIEFLKGVLQNWVADWLSPYATLIKSAVLSGGTALMVWLSKKSRSWATPLLYGLVTATCLYVLLFGVAVSAPQQSLSSPLGFTDEERQRLKFVFLSLPRPCFVKVTATVDNMAFRKGFLAVREESYLNSSQEGHRVLIGHCEFSSDEKDDHPELYPEEMSKMPQGMIVVNGAEAEMVRFLVDEIRKITNFKVRSGTKKPDHIADTWIHIVIGSGPLRWQSVDVY